MALVARNTEIELAPVPPSTLPSPRLATDAEVLEHFDKYFKYLARSDAVDLAMDVITLPKDKEGQSIFAGTLSDKDGQKESVNDSRSWWWNLVCWCM